MTTLTHDILKLNCWFKFPKLAMFHVLYDKDFVQTANLISVDMCQSDGRLHHFYSDTAADWHKETTCTS